jgi:hypothetical protein
VTYLGSRRYTFSERTAAQEVERYYVHLTCSLETPESWIAWERDPSDGSPAPIAFEHF